MIKNGYCFDCNREAKMTKEEDFWQDAYFEYSDCEITYYCEKCNSKMIKIERYKNRR